MQADNEHFCDQLLSMKLVNIHYLYIADIFSLCRRLSTSNKYHTTTEYILCLKIFYNPNNTILQMIFIKFNIAEYLHKRYCFMLKKKRRLN